MLKKSRYSAAIFIFSSFIAYNCHAQKLNKKVQSTSSQQSYITLFAGPGRNTLSKDAHLTPMPEVSFISFEPVVGYLSSTFTGIEGKNGVSVNPVDGFQGGLGLVLGRGQLQLDSGLIY